MQENPTFLMTATVEKPSLKNLDLSNIFTSCICIYVSQGQHAQLAIKLKSTILQTCTKLSACSGSCCIIVDLHLTVHAHWPALGSVPRESCSGLATILYYYAIHVEFSFNMGTPITRTLSCFKGACIIHRSPC